jgi:uncharacterized protein (DUF1778 family)
MATVKDGRLQIRVDPTDKLLLERAAAASHLNVSAFVLQAAAARAEEVIGVYCMNRGSSCSLSRERWAEPSE